MNCVESRPRANAPVAPVSLAGVGFCASVPVSRGSIMASNDPRLPAGTVLDGRFVIGEIVGRSGTATIYQAADLKQDGLEVAVKVPLPKIESDPFGFARFRNEEVIGLELSHPALLKFFPVGEEKTRPYLVTEFLRGSTLDRLVSTIRPIPEADALAIASAICTALGHMHSKGYVHRDIKPANIMVCSDRTLRILDFGLSSRPQRWRSPIARLGTPFGTPQYMAPEQVTQAAADERTDIYCVGAILYELLTGITPLQNDDAWKSAYQRISGDPVAPRKLNPLISPQVEEITLHALQRKPANRYRDMASFRAELDAPGEVVVTGYCDRLRAPRLRLSVQATPILVGLLFGLLVISSLIGLFFFIRGHPTGR